MQVGKYKRAKRRVRAGVCIYQPRLLSLSLPLSDDLIAAKQNLTPFLCGQVAVEH